MSKFTRREFIGKSAVCTAGMVSAMGFNVNSSSSGLKEESELTKSRKFKRICISSWALRRYIRPGKGQGAPKINLIDFPGFIDDSFGVKNLELLEAHFDSTDIGYLDKLIKAMSETGTKVRNIPCGLGIDLSDPDKETRLKDVETAKKWVDIANYIDSGSLRYNVGGKRGGTKKEQIEAAIDSFSRLADYGAERNVKILIENHAGGLSTHYQDLVTVFKAVNSPFFEPLNEPGNFLGTEDAKNGMREYFKLSGWICHIRPLQNIKYITIEEVIKIMNESGYHGYCSIESCWDIQTRKDLEEGISEMINLTLKCLT